MPSKATYLQIFNQTSLTFVTTVSETDNSDWDGNSRPDHNFQNVTFSPHSSIKNREEVNSWNNSAWYRLTIRFPETGAELSFRNDQHDALNGTTSRITMISGDYVIAQHAFSDQSLNVFYVYYKNNQWMAKVNDSVPLTAITIPGTHDSGTKNGNPTPFADDMVITQSMSIAEQLDVGIRFLDIRCNNNAGNFGIQHGDFDIRNMTFGGVLRDCQTFLSAHPSETIVMCVKQEGDANGGRKNSDFAADFRAQYVNNVPWYQGRNLPPVNIARGKIVLINRFDDAFTDFGFPISLNDNDYTNKTAPDGTTYHVQDLYKLDSACDNKVRQVVDFAHDAQRGNGQDWYLNFTSGYNGQFGLYKISTTSDNVNPRVEAALANQKGHLGTFAMDFPTFPLIDELIQSNF